MGGWGNPKCSSPRKSAWSSSPPPRVIGCWRRVGCRCRCARRRGLTGSVRAALVGISVGDRVPANQIADALSSCVNLKPAVREVVLGSLMTAVMMRGPLPQDVGALLRGPAQHQLLPLDDRHHRRRRARHPPHRARPHTVISVLAQGLIDALVWWDSSPTVSTRARCRLPVIVIPSGQEAQQDSLVTSRVKVLAASLRPSAMVRYGHHRSASCCTVIRLARA